MYNEADHIAACLWAIARQTVQPYEVIVVDNNSTDDTVAIAASFPFVTVLHEKKQGVVHARNCGFNAARGHIIGRIDADSRLAADWTAAVIATFTDNPTTQAISGSLHYYDVPCQQLVDGVDARIRAWLGQRTAGAVYLLGANMAIRRTAWGSVGANTCRKSVHEDLDLAAHLSLTGNAVMYTPQLRAGVSGRRADTALTDFVSYLLSMPRTYKLHALRQRKYFYPVMLFVTLFYWVLRIGYRGYDEQTAAFSWRNLLISQAPRVNPVLVD